MVFPLAQKVKNLQQPECTVPINKQSGLWTPFYEFVSSILKQETVWRPAGDKLSRITAKTVKIEFEIDFHSDMLCFCFH